MGQGKGDVTAISTRTQPEGPRHHSKQALEAQRNEQRRAKPKAAGSSPAQSTCRLAAALAPLVEEHACPCRAGSSVRGQTGLFSSVERA